jgi:hypothetical protein
MEKESAWSPKDAVVKGVLGVIGARSQSPFRGRLIKPCLQDLRSVQWTLDLLRLVSSRLVTSPNKGGFRT